MKAFEYKRILEECAETSPVDEVKAAYRLALAMFLMVEIGKPDGNAAESAKQARKTDGGGTGQAAGEESGGAKAGEQEEDAGTKPAAGEKTCLKCGRKFTPDSPRKRICRDCRNGEKNAGEDKILREEGYKKNYTYKPKECKNCGETFTPHYGSQTLCVECARTIDRLAEVKPKKGKPLKLSDPEYRRKMAEDLAKR